MTIQKIEVRYDPNFPEFGLVGEPHEHKQHPNQKRGLDLYVHVINFRTGERCHKKLYENGKGLHFKHTGCSPTYIDDMTAVAEFVPFQVLWIPEPSYNDAIEDCREFIRSIGEPFEGVGGEAGTVYTSLTIVANHMEALKR